MLRANALSKRFGGLQAVSDVSLEVATGSITGLIGPNGAGKTTFFHLVSGFIAPDSGRVEFLGEDITGLPPHVLCRRGIARTFQIVQPFAAQTVRENIAIGTHLHIASRRDALRAAEEVATRVGLGPQAGKPARDLTIAGLKRLELARALATRPKLLMLDEVLAGLNPQEVNDVLPLVRSIRDEGITVLMIEHVMQAVMNLADTIHVLAEGRLLASGAPAAVTADPAVIEAYLGKGAAARLQAAGAGHA